MKKLVAYTQNLIDGHRAAIRSTAGAHGYEAVFCDSLDAALAQAPDAEILFSHDAALLPVARSLKWMCVSFAGVEPFLDPSAYASPGAILTNSSGAYGVTIAEHIVMVAIAMMRRQPEYDRILARREWRRDLVIRSIRGSRITLLGTGDIGRETAMRLRAFAPESITGVNRSGRDAGPLFDRTLPVSELDDVLPETDLLVMSLPGTPATNGLMDRRRLALLPKDAFLVNVGRGNAVDEAALVELMQGGHLGGAALDVFSVEPLPKDHPLWDCPRVLITSHTAGNMTLGYTVDRIVEMFLEDFENYCAGRPMAHMVDRALGY